MADLIGQISTVMKMFKMLRDTPHIMNDATSKLEIANITSELADIKNELINKDDEIRNLRTELDNLNNNPLVYSGVVYHDKDKYPYCPACYDSQKKRIHLKANRKQDGYHRFICPVCDACYHEEDFYSP